MYDNGDFYGYVKGILKFVKRIKFVYLIPQIKMLIKGFC